MQGGFHACLCVHLQVSEISDSLPASIYDFGVDLLSCVDSQGCGSGEGGSSEGDCEDDGIEEFHLLAELGHQQHIASRRQRRAPHYYSQGD